MSESETKSDFLHPSFKTKTVYFLECAFCKAYLCSRAMKAKLLADITIEMFSTDYPLPTAIDTVGQRYSTTQCKCQVKDAACLQCGNVLGYHVATPCRKCLLSSNNGHLWMFFSNSVIPSDRLNSSGDDLLTWGALPSIQNEACDFLGECVR